MPLQKAKIRSSLVSIDKRRSQPSETESDRNEKLTKENSLPRSPERDLEEIAIIRRYCCALAVDRLYLRFSSAVAR